MEIKRRDVPTAVWVACLVAQETFSVIFVEMRETEDFHIDELGEDLIPPIFNDRWFVSLKNGNQGGFTPSFGGIVSFLNILAWRAPRGRLGGRMTSLGSKIQPFLFKKTLTAPKTW